MTEVERQHSLFYASRLRSKGVMGIYTHVSALCRGQAAPPVENPSGRSATRTMRLPSALAPRECFSAGSTSSASTCRVSEQQT